MMINITIIMIPDYIVRTFDFVPRIGLDSRAIGPTTMFLGSLPGKYLTWRNISPVLGGAVAAKCRRVWTADSGATSMF